MSTYIPQLIGIEAPGAIFDVSDGLVFRLRRVPVALVDEFAGADSGEAACAVLARIFPRWKQILDVQTGEPLPNPSEDPSVFMRVDAVEQLPWFGEQIRARPNPTLAT